MENNRMNPCGYRPYYPPCRPSMEPRPVGKPEVCEDLGILPLAMGYVPWQHYHHTFELCKGLQVGTIFPELCKPFCGKRGGRPC